MVDLGEGPGVIRFSATGIMMKKELREGQGLGRVPRRIACRWGTEGRSGRALLNTVNSWQQKKISNVEYFAIQKEQRGNSH